MVRRLAGRRAKAGLGTIVLLRLSLVPSASALQGLHLELGLCGS